MIKDLTKELKELLKSVDIEWNDNINNINNIIRFSVGKYYYDFGIETDMNGELIYTLGKFELKTKYTGTLQIYETSESILNAIKDIPFIKNKLRIKKLERIIENG